MKKARKIKVAVAISGGVDSSVAAALLKKQGYDVFGVFMHFWNESVQGKARDNVCCSLESQEDARRVCQQLDIPFYTMNMSVPFKKKIVDDFVDEYENCRTPNPCVRCNKYIKFGEFLKKARLLGAEYIATGHYARIAYGDREILNPKSEILNKSKIPNPKSKIRLWRSADKQKDQTYFLHGLTQAQLKRVLFPVGNYKKAQVRALAKKFGLAVHSKKESQEICFIPSGDTAEFLQRHLNYKKGAMKDVATKKTVGEHDSLAFYTVGQRKGIGLAGGPWYVSRLDKKNNVLWITKNAGDLLCRDLIVKNVNWIAGVKPKFPISVKCKIRYRAADSLATVNELSNGRYVVKFKKPERAVTPGQHCVFWKGDECFGGGEIV
ncbi:MAG: tRNA 2-thiouridine(34) synthase MnmA [Parcubacteria group bacterium]